MPPIHIQYRELYNQHRQWLQFSSVILYNHSQMKLLKLPFLLLLQAFSLFRHLLYKVYHDSTL